MRIREVHLYAYELPSAGPDYVMSSAVVRSLDTTLVRLVGEDGTEGWGETCPVGPTYAEAHAAGARAALTQMGQGLVGAELWPIPLHRRMDGLLNGHRYAKAAVDIAAHDLLGRQLGVSVAELLGGGATPRVPSYYSISVGEPEDAAEIARDKVAEGFPRLQIKLGGRPVEVDIETMHRVWEAVRGTGVRIAADANRGMTSRDALHLSRSCREIPMVMEQICNSVEEMIRLRPQVQHPIYLDESSVDLNAVITEAGRGLADGFGMKVNRIGGLHPMRTFRDICAARRLPHTCDEAWGGDIIAAACVQVGATVADQLNDGVWIAAPYIDGHYDEVGVSIEGGHITVPTGPGLGVTPAPGIFGEPVASFG